MVIITRTMANDLGRQTRIVSQLTERLVLSKKVNKSDCRRVYLAGHFSGHIRRLSPLPTCTCTQRQQICQYYGMRWMCHHISITNHRRVGIYRNRQSKACLSVLALFRLKTGVVPRSVEEQSEGPRVLLKSESSR